MTKFFTLFITFTLTLFATEALLCKVVNEDEILKIKCIYKTARKDYDRNITMAWTSPSTPQDDRFKTVLLPAQHASAYDFRYFDGRADGAWTISATDDSTGKVTSIEFVKEDLGEATIMAAPDTNSSLENPASSQ